MYIGTPDVHGDRRGVHGCGGGWHRIGYDRDRSFR